MSVVIALSLIVSLVNCGARLTETERVSAKVGAGVVVHEGGTVTAAVR